MTNTEFESASDLMIRQGLVLQREGKYDEAALKYADAALALQFAGKEDEALKLMKKLHDPCAALADSEGKAKMKNAVAILILLAAITICMIVWG